MCPESPVWLESIGERELADISCIKLWGPYAIVPDMESEDTNLMLGDDEVSAVFQLLAVAGGSMILRDNCAYHSRLTRHSSWVSIR